MNFVTGAYVLGDPRYQSIARKLRDDGINVPQCQNEWARPWLIASGSLPGINNDPVIEPLWQVGIVLEACQVALDFEDDESWKVLRDKCLRILGKGVVFDAASGNAIGIHRELQISSSGVTPRGDVTWVGVHHWPTHASQEQWGKDGVKWLAQYLRGFSLEKGDERGFEWGWRHEVGR
jgi:hypothetical protein